MKSRAKVIMPIFSVMITLTSKVSLAQEIPDGQYFGQEPPGLTPEVFAPGIVSLENRYEYILTFSPGLSDCVFGITNSSWSSFTLKFTKMAEDSSWIEPITAPFIAPDENYLIFESNRPGGYGQAIFM